MINTHGVKSPTAKEGWAGKPVEMGPGGRDAWDGDRLEKLIKEKLMMRTKSGNGQATHNTTAHREAVGVLGAAVATRAH